MVAAEAVEGVDLEEDEEGEVVVEVEAVAVEVVVIRIVMREEIDPTSHTNITPCGLDKYTLFSHYIVKTVFVIFATAAQTFCDVLGNKE